MTRRGKITEEQVFEAANSLIEEGKEVTPTTLLARIGSGSYTTIYKHLDAWEAKRASAVASVTHNEIPDSVKAAYAAAWRAATAEAAREIIAIREKTQEEIRAAQKRLEDALNTIDKLESESEADANEIDSLTEKLEHTEKALHGAENETAALKASSGELQKRINSQEIELERVHKELESERKRHQDERAQANASHLAAQEKHESMIAQLRREIDDQRKDKESVLGERAGLLGQIEALKGHNAELLMSLTSIKAENKSSRKILILKIKSKDPNNNPLTHPRAASESIEKNILEKMNLSKIYEQDGPHVVGAIFEFGQDTDEEMSRLPESALSKCKQEADKFKCSVEVTYK